MPLLPHHLRQLEALREWARKTGKTRSAISNPENAQLADREKRIEAHKALTETAHPVSIPNAEGDTQPQP